MICIVLSSFAYIFNDFIDFHENAWFLMDLPRFSKSKMFAKIIDHSFWPLRIPCTFREVRFKLRRIYKLSIASAALFQHSMIRKEDVASRCEWICCKGCYGFSEICNHVHWLSLVSSICMNIYVFHHFSSSFKDFHEVYDCPGSELIFNFQRFSLQYICNLLSGAFALRVVSV